MRIVDLSRELYHRTPSYPGQPPIIHGVWKTHEEARPRPAACTATASCSSPCRTTAAPTSTRRAISDAGTPINEYPLEILHRAGHLPRPPPHRAEGRDHAGDLEAAVKKAGVPIPKSGTVLLCTGHHERTFPKPAYSTDNSGVNVAATEWLAKQGIVHFGIELHAAGPGGQGEHAGPQGLPRARHHPHREPVQSRGADRARPVPVHRAAAEIARRHRLADPGGGDFPGLEKRAERWW